ncbi:hypothetical protein HKX48_000009 [Thoreauomyces humboldtii]|nr:hypothetical protein HKX48_000009 [Thoreauomyces humboldtii]
MESENVPLVRRRSGGGTVYHDIGNTNYTIIMPRENFDRVTNAELIVRGLHQLDIPASVNERHDIVVDGKKVSGSAYKLVNNRAYHHGTMLIDADLGALGRYLRPPVKNLVGKGVDSVRSTVGKLRDHSYTVDHSTFSDAVAEEFCRTHRVSLIKPIELTMKHLTEHPKIQEYLDEIKTWDWIYGQTPDFTHRLEKIFSWAKVDIIIRSHRGLITESSVSVGAADWTALALRLAERLIGKHYSKDGVAEAFRFEDRDTLTDRHGDQVRELERWLVESL